MKTLEGNLVADPSWRFVLVASRFNSLVVDPLVAGAAQALRQHGVQDSQLKLVRVPGAWELGWACARVAETLAPDAIIALGAVVRGSTPHFDVVVSELSGSLGRQSGRGQGVLTLGVLTTDTMEQAADRAGGKFGNKGAEAALAALEMVSLEARLRAEPR